MARPAKKSVVAAKNPVKSTKDAAAAAEQPSKETTKLNGHKEMEDVPEPAAVTADVVAPLPAVNTTNAKKRGRRTNSESSEKSAAKKVKLDFAFNRGYGHVLTVGQGDTGQLGLGEDVMEKSRPQVVTTLSEAVDVVAGGMHSVVLTKDGEVYTFGCNDEGSLGRNVGEEEECFVPGKVDIDGRVVMISAGDSHSAALTEDGRVFAWGTFRDSSGPIGLTLAGIQKLPMRMFSEVVAKKISSGSDHLVALSVDGFIFTLGNSEQELTCACQPLGTLPY
jgi:regulator of chromosome condensation